jgi:uncharacterized protein
MIRISPLLQLTLLAALQSVAYGVTVTDNPAPLPPGAEIAGYVGRDVMIPMRDGVKLHAEVWRPKDFSGKLPVLVQRSPYGLGMAKDKESFAREYRELAKEQFIFVLEDIRGRFGSEGKFVMLRPEASTPNGIDESTDSYDTIDWIVKSVPDNNGRVGVFGVSYLGWTTAMATIKPHPALKAVSVQASPEDMYMGDDFHHNGAFRLQYGWEYAAALETDGHTLKPFNYGKDDPYSWLLKQDQLAGLDERALHLKLPTWQDFAAHPNYDRFWRARVTSSAMATPVKIPNLIVAGWWDQEDFYGPLTIYKRQRKADPDGRDFIVIGPWDHGGWMREEGERYGPLVFGSATGAYFRTQAETPWFKYWLKQEGKLDQPKALVFETGSDQWQRYDAWPPRAGVKQQQLYLHTNHVLSFAAPAAGEDDKPDQFVSDPANPVPYRQPPIATITAEDTTWRIWQADDQAPFAKRPDVLSWQTEVLDHDVTIRGALSAKLFASTTGTDADWIVKVIDVYPDNATPAEMRNRQLMIADDVFRGRFRSDFEHPKPLVAGKVFSYEVDLHSASHVFKKGHRIAVQVQSTWFPLIDRNPQTFVPSIFAAKANQYTAQTHSVFHTARYPSALVFDMAQNEPSSQGGH